MTERRAFLISFGMAIALFVLSLPVVMLGMYFVLVNTRLGRGVFMDLQDKDPSTPGTTTWMVLGLLGLVCIAASAKFAWSIFSSGYAVLKPYKQGSD